MTLYDQACKHHSCHRKDKFYQQCSGYFGISSNETSVKDANYFFITDKEGNRIEGTTVLTWKEIVQIARKIEDKQNHFIWSLEYGLMGRIDVYNF